MSQWTQVGGSIRIDSMSAILDNTPVDGVLEKALGQIVTYESPQEDWDVPEEKRTPMGSEGGLSYHITRVAEDNSLCNTAVLISGSLRDYGLEDYQEIREWLNRFVKNLNDTATGIRQAAVEARVEGLKHVVFVYDDEKEEFIEHVIWERDD